MGEQKLNIISRAMAETLALCKSAGARRDFFVQAKGFLTPLASAEGDTRAELKN